MRMTRMTARINFLRKWLLGGAIGGRSAVATAIAAVALPTAVRFAVHATVSGSALSPYIPFVLLSAVLLGWKWALAVAVGSAIIGDILFIGTPFHFLEGVSDAFAIAIFLLTSGLIISFVELTRSTVGQITKLVDPEDFERGVIFSLEKGQAWASWYGAGMPVRLGAQEVAAKMRDFLAQLEVGKRLNRSKNAL